MSDNRAVMQLTVRLAELEKEIGVEAMKILQRKTFPLPESRMKIFVKMHAFCIAEAVGVEYLLLLLVQPANLVERHHVLPSRMFRELLGIVSQGKGENQESKEDMETENGNDKENKESKEGNKGNKGNKGDKGNDKPHEITNGFMEDLSVYVQALSKFPAYGLGLCLPEPSPYCGVDILRCYFYTGFEQDEFQHIAYLMSRLRKLGIVNVSQTVKITVSFSDRSSANVLDLSKTVSFKEYAVSVYILSTNQTHTAVLDTIRNRAKARLGKLEAMDVKTEKLRNEVDKCKILSSIEGRWDGEFRPPWNRLDDSKMSVYQPYSSPQAYAFLMYSQLSARNDEFFTDTVKFLFEPCESVPTLHPILSYSHKVQEVLDAWHKTPC